MDDFSEQLVNGGYTTLPNLLLQHFKDLNMTGDEFTLYLALTSFKQQGIDFPSAQQLGMMLGLSEEQVFQELHQLIEKKLIAIQTTAATAQQRQQDRYDLQPVYSRLQLILKQAAAEDKQNQRQAAQQDLFKQIEVEFGRMLSPIEIETVNAWLKQDHYNTELIELALREAVLNQVYSLKYMDRILLSWEKKNITSKAQVQREKDLRNQY